MAYETILAAAEAGVLTITLNRPERFNALTPQVLTELQDALRSAERDEGVKVIVLTGAGRAFCAGQDLKTLDQLEQPGERGPQRGPSRAGVPERFSFAEFLRRNYNPLILRLRASEKPIVGAINGPAAGAGMSLALACDLRIVSDAAFFQTGFVGIGLVPDSGMLFFLPRLVGPAKAAELIMLNDRVQADEALRLGLANRVVPADQLLPTTYELAQRLARGPSKALGLVKRGLNRSLVSDLEAMLEYEAQLQELAGRSDDFREGVAAFVQKRPPEFKGR
jgi:2-(1,2-epoxy-1,2-dihydrophenyl)acetyl-CoA isomerase